MKRWTTFELSYVRKEGKELMFKKPVILFGTY